MTDKEELECLNDRLRLTLGKYVGYLGEEKAKNEMLEKRNDKLYENLSKAIKQIQKLKKEKYSENQSEL
jgi:hypothetical protein